jgi:hypothetical protein
MNLVWGSSLEGSSHRFVLLALADRADDDGYCWPGVQSVAQKTGLSPSTVRRVYRDLEQAKLLMRIERWTPNGDRDTNGYWINVEALMDRQLPRESGRGRHPMAQAAGSRGYSHHDTTPSHGDRGGTSTMTPNTSVDPPTDIKKPSDTSYRARTERPSVSRLPHFDPEDDPLEWISEQVDGFDGCEETMAFSMLVGSRHRRGKHPHAIVNKILKDRGA